MDNGGIDVITLATFVRRLKLDNMNNWDSFVVIDMSPACRHGPVGGGKSALLSQLIVALHPHATLAKNLVIRNDIEHYEALLQDKRKFVVCAVDEAEWWFYKRRAMYREQVERIMEMMSNRKEAKYHLLALPRIWDLDKVILNDRVQWRLRVERRGVVSLHMRNSPTMWSITADLWGAHVCTFFDVPMPPDYLWREYQRCIDAYRPAVWSGTGRDAQMITPAVRAEDVWELDHALSPTRDINPAQPESGGHVDTGGITT